MRSLLIKIKNLAPYLLLIAIYFFFVNIEARKNQNNTPNKFLEQTNQSQSDIEEENRTISIPVIPYNQ